MAAAWNRITRPPWHCFAKGPLRATFADIQTSEGHSHRHLADIEQIIHGSDLAQAVKQLFPSAQVTIGPVIEDGFYYDFSYERPFTPEDLARIEQKMAELASANQAVSRTVKKAL